MEGARVAAATIRVQSMSATVSACLPGRATCSGSLVLPAPAETPRCRPTALGWGGGGRAPADSLDVIGVDECYERLASHEVGRIGVNAEHVPLIIPVTTAWTAGRSSSAPIRARR